MSISLRTMKLCKTCQNAEKVGKGFYCELTGKSCGVHPRDVDEDCVNYGKPSFDIPTGLEIK